MPTSLKRVHVIINPISGADFPILPHLVRALNAHKIDWEIFITKNDGDAALFTRKAIEAKVDAVVVHGGDGSIMEVALALCQTKTPMIIIPGGTANVLAKELGIPLDVPNALRIFSKKKPRLKVVDMGKCNGKPFVLRVNVGIFADMVKRTTRARKNALGTMGYVVSAFEHIAKRKSSLYEMVLDGKSVEIEGVALMIANSSNVGVTGISLAPRMSMSDGFLDVLVVQSADATTMLSMLKGAMQQKKSPSLKHFKVKNAQIHIDPMQTIVHDDVVIEARSLNISVIPEAVHILV